MPKQKMTSGVLCRDKDDDGEIVFFPGLRRRDVRSVGRGYWEWKKGYIEYTEFSLEDWKKTYDMKPPRRGTAFEVEIEL